MTPILLSSLAIMAASLGGVLFVWRGAHRFVERNLDFLISFSAGVFLVVIYRLANETLEHAESIGSGLLWVGVGALAVWLLVNFLPGLHEHHHASDSHDHHAHKIDVRRMLVSDALHNVGDGMFIAASFATDRMLGFAAAASVFVHELVQGISEFFVLRGGGYSARQALTLNFIVSASILIGSIGGYLLLERIEMLEVPLLGLAAGAFLVVVLHDLIPHSVRSSFERMHYTKHLLWFAAGLALMVVVTALFMHAHEASAASLQIL